MSSPWLMACGMLVGCAHEMGKHATEGMIEGVKKEAAKSGSASDGTAPAVEQVTGSVVQGTLEQLAAPEEQARLRQVIAAMVAQAVDTATHRLTGPAGGGTGAQRASPLEAMSAQAAHAFATSLSAELSAALGLEGRGPLGAQLSAASHGLAASAAHGLSAGAAEALPGCGGLAPERCWQARVEAMSESAATGFARGLRHELGWWALAAAFVAGMLVMAALTLLARGFVAVSPRRHRVGAPAPA